MGEGVRANKKRDTAAHAKVDVRWLLPQGVVRAASTVTPEWLEDRLAAYAGNQNTKRRVHSSWSQFFAWCEKRKVLGRTPMQDVERPALALSPIHFYDLTDAKRIMEAQPDAARRAFMALMYGTGADVSPALPVRRQDIDDASKQVRLAGTKSSHRDRIARIADWAWPFVVEHAKTHLGPARLFP